MNIKRVLSWFWSVVVILSSFGLIGCLGYLIYKYPQHMAATSSTVLLLLWIITFLTSQVKR